MYCVDFDKDDDDKVTLRTICRDRINIAVQEVYHQILTAFHKTGDDFLLPKSFDEAIDNLAEDLEFMLLNNPMRD